VLNLLRSLNPKFRHLKPDTKSKSPPHTFRSAMSYELLKEASDSHEVKTDTAQAYFARNGGPSFSVSTAGGSDSSSTGGTDDSSAGGPGGS
jgi:hypothetical protein